MKKGYKECPFCKNEIKEGATKCQYCKEFLDEEVRTKQINGSKNSTTKIEERVANRGPSNRWGKLKFFLFSIGFNIGAILLMVLLGEAGGDDGIAVVWVINLFCHVYFLSKRFHDCGNSGWYALICLLFSPLILIMYFVNGDAGDNKYGPAPQ